MFFDADLKGGYDTWPSPDTRILGITNFNFTLSSVELNESMIRGFELYIEAFKRHVSLVVSQ